MTMYKRNRKQLAMRIFCALLLGTCLLGGHQPVSADVATLTTNFFNRNISVNTNSGSVVLSLSGTATEPLRLLEDLPWGILRTPGETTV